MTYCVSGNLHNYDIENILNMFGLEKARDGAEMVLTLDERILRLHGAGVEFSTPLFYADGSPVDKDELKRRVYRYLCGIFGEPSGWGILVGVRPVKLASQMLVSGMTSADVSDVLVRDYLLARDNADLLVMIAEYENTAAPMRQIRSVVQGDDVTGNIVGNISKDGIENVAKYVSESVDRAASQRTTQNSDGRVCESVPSRNHASLYLSVPFCPTRCKYCSFPMQPLLTKRKLLPVYFEKLKIELEETLKMLVHEGVNIDCIYFGGGTPSTLETHMIEALGSILKRYIDFGALNEFTFEAGRSDTVNRELIDVLVKIGAGRVSINPQSFTEAALIESQRQREEGEFERAFDLARNAGLKINSDLILGLAGEDEQQYLEGLRYLIGLRPENITVHALSLKRGSPLFGERIQMEQKRQSGCSLGQEPGSVLQPSSHSEQCSSGGILDKSRDLKQYLQSQRRRYLSMSRGGADILKAAGYSPYYLYRQKRILANLENIGYSLEGEGCLYNSRIMSERYDIFAVGTGGVTKICYPSENRHEQIAGTRSVEDYIDRFSKVLDRIETVRGYIRSEHHSCRESVE